MIGQAAVEELREVEGLAWITALKGGQIRTLVEGGALQLGLFEEKNLFELSLIEERRFDFHVLDQRERQAPAGDAAAGQDRGVDRTATA
jgi:hypothetical protein